MRNSCRLSGSDLRTYGQTYKRIAANRMLAQSLGYPIRRRIKEKPKKEKRGSARTIAQLGLLTAIALTIFVLEMQIPPLVPIPGVKLGLANIITVYAMFYFRWYEVAGMTAARITLGAIFGGQIMALLYSAAGSTLCLLGMIPLSKIVPKKCIFLCSMIGAVLHNCGQILAAVAVMGTAVLAYFPFFLVSGLITGLFTGLCAQILVNKLNKKKVEKEIGK